MYNVSMVSCVNLYSISKRVYSYFVISTYSSLRLDCLPRSHCRTAPTWQYYCKMVSELLGQLHNYEHTASSVSHAQCLTCTATSQYLVCPIVEYLMQISFSLQVKICQTCLPSLLKRFSSAGSTTIWSKLAALEEFETLAKTSTTRSVTPSCSTRSPPKTAVWTCLP